MGAEVGCGELTLARQSAGLVILGMGEIVWGCDGWHAVQTNTTHTHPFLSSLLNHHCPPSHPQQVVNGPRYVLSLNGNGHKPRLDLSFYSHDFGTVPLWAPGIAPARKTLRLTNNDSAPVAVDPQWAGAASAAGQEGEVWSLDFPPAMLQPGESRDATISFRPPGAQPYAMRLPLEVNGLYTVHVDFKGEGAPLRIEPANPTQRTVAFGAVPRGQGVSRIVPLVNRGRVAATLSLGPSAAMLSRLGIEVLPAADVVLRPREALDLTFFYRWVPGLGGWGALSSGAEKVLILRVGGACWL